jgi:hypothetical protein
MKLIVRNLITSHVSTPIGDVAPGVTLTMTVDSNKFNAMSSELKILETKGYISVTVQSDSGPTDKYSPAAVPTMLSAPLNLYVDQAIGSDSNDGLAPNSALKTITAALNLVPQTVAETCKILVKAGTYTENLNINRNFVPSPKGASRVQIEGLDFVVPTLGSGSITTGTLGAASQLTRTTTVTGAAACKYAVAGASWGVNELKGKFINVTGGVSSFLFGLYPIAGNVAASLDIPTTGLSGAVFTIVDHGVVLTAPAAKYTGITVSNNSGNVNNGVVFKNLCVNTGSFYNAMFDAGALQFWGCLVKGATSLGIYCMSPHTSLAVFYSYLTGSPYGVYALGMNRLQIGGIVIDGGQRQIYISNAPLNMLDCYDMNILQNGQFGLLCHSGPSIVNETATAHLIVRNQSVHGVNLSSGAKWTANCEIFSCNIGLKARALIEGEPNGTNRLVGTWMVTDCTGDGIEIGGNHNYLGIQSGNISGNGGIGINMNIDLNSSHNALSILSAGTNTVMASNSGGDIKHTNGGSTSTLNTYKTSSVTTDAPSLTRVDVA